MRWVGVLGFAAFLTLMFAIGDVPLNPVVVFVWITLIEVVTLIKLDRW